MNCIIIDDENNCIESLSTLLETEFGDVAVMATCSDSTEAFNLIQQQRPDFIFLDIEMPQLNGFELLAKFEHLDFDVIFTTANDSYAIKAIKFSALDYLLKPINKEDLAVAIEKIKNKLISISPAQLQMATAVFNQQLPDTIALPAADGLTFVSIDDIVYCMADSGNTRLFMADKSEILITKLLGDVDDLLDEYDFFRIHHSSLINLTQVEKYMRDEGGEVIMNNGHNLLVARTRKADFLNVFTRF